MEYSRNIPKKCNHNENIGNSGIWNIPWNIPAIFQKKITTHGGVKFNQAKKCLSAIAYMNAHISS